MKKIFLYIGIALGTYVSIWIVIALTNSYSELSGIDRASWLGFFASMLGTIITLIGAYFLNEIDSRDKENKERKFAEKVIFVFLENEIKFNLDMARIERIKVKLNEENVLRTNILQYGFSNEFVFDEFDKIKFQILSYDTEITKLTIEVYNFLYRLKAKKDYKYFKVSEIKEFIEKCDKLNNLLSV